jgi:uncharacterized damage-inducible protein DinB
LVTQIFAQESEEFPIILEKGEVDFMKIRPPKWKTVDEVIDLFKMNIEKTEKIVNKMSEEEWNSKARMMSGNKVEWESTKGKMIWGLMLDMIHHRGQLSTYLRPMGGEIPSIYGPTADNPDM